MLWFNIDKWREDTSEHYFSDMPKEVVECMDTCEYFGRNTEDGNQERGFKNHIDGYIHVKGKRGKYVQLGFGDGRVHVRLYNKNYTHEEVEYLIKMILGFIDHYSDYGYVYTEQGGMK